MRLYNAPHLARLLALAALAVAPTPAAAIPPDDPGPADVRFTISSAAPKPISPYIYGMNSFVGSSLPNPVTLDRLGGNRWSGYNWETNASNAGADFNHQSDNYLVSFQGNTPPGEAVRPSLVAAAAAKRGQIVTVPVAGYASADTAGPVTTAQAAPSTRWRQVVAKKSTIYPGSPLSLSPNEGDGYVFTDEFVNWVEQTKQPGHPVFYSLDNEPGLWNSTHPRLHPGDPRFDELRDKTIAHAAAIKDVNPNALVFGGVGYGWNDFRSLQDAADRVTSPAHPGGDQGGELHYYEWLLQQVAAEEAAQGRTLVDVLDLHWYPEAQGGGTRIVQFGGTINNSAAVVAARVQAPRSLWDETYTETSWITDCCSGGPIKLLKHVQRDINDFKPGTKIAVTEYNYGGSNHISGAIAQADVLGIFGREEVFAANFWNLHGDSQAQFVAGAFNMYLNYDGAGGRFGDLAVDAATDSIAQSAVYASVDSQDPSRMFVVAINRTGQSRDAGFAVTHDQRFDVAEVYQLTSASSSPVRVNDILITKVNAFVYAMPAYSVSTLVLRSAADGDFNLDGAIDGADLDVWASHFATAGMPHFSDGDNDRDGDVDGQDFLAWQRALGNSLVATQRSAAPEPAAIVLICVAGLRFAVHLRR